MRPPAQVLVPGRQNLSLVFAWALDHDPLATIARAVPDPGSDPRTGITTDSEAAAGGDADAAFDAAEVLAAADRLTHPNGGETPRANRRRWCVLVILVRTLLETGWHIRVLSCL